MVGASQPPVSALSCLRLPVAVTPAKSTEVDGHSSLTPLTSRYEALPCHEAKCHEKGTAVPE